MENMYWETANAIYDTAHYAVVRKLRGVKVPAGKGVVEVCVSFEMHGNVAFYDREIRPESGLEEDDPILQAIKEALEGINDQIVSLANATNGGFEEEGGLTSGVWSLPITDEEYQEARENALRSALKLASALADE